MAWIERHWQARTPLAVALYPASLVFRLVTSTRKALFRLGLRQITHPPVPVIIVGNITVGGAGKTPLVLWLAAFLRERGWRPGIVSRGYGGKLKTPHAVSPHDDPATCGDEAIVLARRSDCPVCIGRDRVAATRALLTARADCNVILSDDGLQHYALARDFEIAVIDGERGLGNGWLLPAGPLREPQARLDSVDAVIANGDMDRKAATKTPLYGMRLEGRRFENLLNREHSIMAPQLQRLRIHAVAGIGHPQRFFSHLRQLGLTFTAHAFPDHHRYVPRDLAFADADAVVMTEKDAVKCERFATERYWVLPVDAVVDPALGQHLLRHLGHRDEQ